MRSFKLILSLLFIIITLITIFENLTFSVTKYIIKDTNLPLSFNHFRIVQISDLHSTFYDTDNSVLINSIKAQNPDIIAITGDYFNKRTRDIDKLLDFTEKLVKIADCYFVTGNHEAIFSRDFGCENLIDKIQDAGVKSLENTCQTISRGNDSINLIGLTDPLFIEVKEKKYTKASLVIEKYYKKINISGYNILLTHRPYEFETYLKFSPNIILSGHEHGGQFRLPLIGGLFAPGEGFFPKYENGVFKKNKTTMIVSRGLGNGDAPIRIFNRPELVVIELER